MKLRNSGAKFFIPDGRPTDKAVQRTTHMAISAHQDDIEIMAGEGILKCFGREDEWFFAVVVTDGAGSPRNGLYAGYSGEQLQAVRQLEQKKAAFVGEYGALALLNYSSSEAKDPKNSLVTDEIKALVTSARPKIVYTHNLADKHDTHVSVAIKAVQALRELPEDIRPEKLYGCEVWRSLDWLNDEDKVLFDVSAHPNIASAVVSVHDSQICGGKRYDLATAGRRIANATYMASHYTDGSSALIYGMDLTPLITDASINIKEFVRDYIERFASDVGRRLERLSKG